MAILKQLFNSANAKIIGSTAMISVSLLIYLLERKRPERKNRQTGIHDSVNAAAGLLSKASNSLMEQSVEWVFDYTGKKDIGLLRRLKLSPGQDILATLLLMDLWMYWWHRLNHTVPFLWRFHSFHHQDKMLTSTTAIRFHPGEIVISSLLRVMVLAPLGFDKKHITIYESILLPVIVFHHSNIKISRENDFMLRRLLVTPLMHRTHHSVNRSEADSNYGSVLPYWDMLFGSYIKEVQDEIEFGIGEVKGKKLTPGPSLEKRGE